MRPRHKLTNRRKATQTNNLWFGLKKYELLYEDAIIGKKNKGSSPTSLAKKFCAQRKESLSVKQLCPKGKQETRIGQPAESALEGRELH